MGSVYPEVMPVSQLNVYCKRQRKPSAKVAEMEGGSKVNDVAESLLFMSGDKISSGARNNHNRAGEGAEQNGFEEEELRQEQVVGDKGVDQGRKVEQERGFERCNIDKPDDEEKADQELAASKQSPVEAKKEQVEQATRVQDVSEKMDTDNAHESCAEAGPAKAHKTQISYQRRNKRPADCSTPQKTSAAIMGTPQRKRSRDEPHASVSDIMNIGSHNSDHQEPVVEAGREVTSSKEKSQTPRDRPKRGRNASTRVGRLKDIKENSGDRLNVQHSDNEENQSNPDMVVLKKAPVIGLAKGVSRWLEALNLVKYAENFEKHEVEDEVLPLLTFDDLREMGITAVGARRKMYTAIQEMEKKKLLI